MKKVIVIGAGGHGRVAADIIRLSGDEVAGFLDDNLPEKLSGFNVIGNTGDIGKWSDCMYFVAVGNAEIRKKIMSNNVPWYTAVHPTAVIADNVKIGEGSLLAANSVVNSGSEIGKGCIVNTAATVDHDCILENFVHISPGAHLSGSVKIGVGTWIGVGACIVNNVEICGGCIIGAGAAVIHNIDVAGTYVGVPTVKVN
ncbi:MAG: acetyltransferase [Oscillospiraceae bacterium]|nr:acetyltransferase [Oscillospiraceae bacterium]MDE7279955.1 acetyltransferase [Oscillospiraceae bacterium]